MFCFFSIFYKLNYELNQTQCLWILFEWKNFRPIHLLPTIQFNRMQNSIGIDSTLGIYTIVSLFFTNNISFFKTVIIRLFSIILALNLALNCWKIIVFFLSDDCEHFLLIKVEFFIYGQAELTFIIFMFENHNMLIVFSAIVSSPSVQSLMINLRIDDRRWCHSPWMTEKRLLKKVDLCNMKWNTDLVM